MPAFDLPPSSPRAEPERLEELPRAIILPANQSAEDRDAFMRWLEKQWGAFIRKKLACRRDLVEESKKDLAQRVLLIVCGEYDKNKQIEHVRAFLDRVIEHEILNHKRRSRLNIDPGADAAEELAPGPSPESAAERAERWEKLERYLTYLPREEAEVFEAKEAHWMTFEEVAATVGRPRTTVARQYDRALEKLREMALASEREAALRARRWVER